MILELLTAYGLIIGTIVGTGQALQAMDAEGRADLSSNTTSGAISDETMTLKEKVVPIGQLTGVSESQPTQKDVPSENQIHQEKPPKNLVGDPSRTEEEIMPTPVSLESDPVDTGLEISSNKSVSKPEKPYDVFEAIGFDDEEDDLEQWAK